MTRVLFDDRCSLLHDRIDIQAVAPLTRDDYTIGGTTALLDAIGIAIHKIRKVQRTTSEEFRAEKVMFFIITDGHENASRHYTASMIQERINHQKQKYGWEFLFFGANMYAIAEAAKIGIAADRAQNYCADSVGTSSVYSSMSAMSTAFRTGKLISSIIQTDVTSEKTEPQSAKAALENLRKVAGGLRDTMSELVGEFEEMVRVAKANGGKFPDVDEIARQVLGEKSDIHGCYDEYKKLLKKINLGPDDALYLLGDVIDRGANGFKILLDMAKRPNVVNLMGNHEAMALEALSGMPCAVRHTGEMELSEDTARAVDLWFHNGGELSLADFLWLNEEQTQTIWEYMCQMPLYKEVEAEGQRFVLVHGGLEGFCPPVPWMTTHRRKSCGIARMRTQPTTRISMWFSDIPPSSF